MCRISFSTLLLGAMGLQLSAGSACAGGCDGSSILFSFNNSLFEVGVEGKLTEVVKGLKAPRDIAWAPGCSHYGFIDSGSLWVGSLHQQPSELDIPGEVFEYAWDPDGRSIAAVVDGSACNTRSESQGLEHRGDIYLVLPFESTIRRLTNDCKSYLLGWSDEGRSMLVDRKVSLPCAPNLPECATGDVVALNTKLRSEATLLTAEKLREYGWSDPKLLWWDSNRGLLYVWCMASPIGGVGLVAAFQVPLGRVLWTFEAWEATMLSTGRIGVRSRQVEDYDTTGRNWSHLYVTVRDGKVLDTYLALPSQLPEAAGPISGDGKYILWFEPDYSRQVWHLHFATRTEPKAWTRQLPRGFTLIDAVWTPRERAIVLAYRKSERNDLIFQIWSLDPQEKVNHRVFEGTFPLPPDTDADSLARGATVSLPGGKVKEFIPPLVLARWTR